MKWFLFLLLSPIIFYGQTQFDIAEQCYKEGNIAKAKPLFEAYLKEFPTDVMALEYLGDIAGNAKQWDAALDYYKVLVAKDKTNADYHFKCGGVLGMKALTVNKISAAFYITDVKEYFDTAATLDPGHIEVRKAMVELYMQLPAMIGGSEAKALFYANELAELSPVEGSLAKGYIAAYNDKIIAAENFYKKAVIQGGTLLAYDKLVAFYKNTNQPSKALETLKENLALHPSENRLNYQIGHLVADYNLELHLGVNSLKKYLEDYFLKDGIPKEWAYLRLAQIHKNKGNKSIALSWIRKALMIAPAFKEAIKEKMKIEAL
ncbi:MAG: putative Zn-dependent protease [Saprospiraceae bacterium]|jgi:predicted Zn-dependent protease